MTPPPSLCASSCSSSSDAPLAARCLKAGEHIFALADTKHKGKLLTAIPFGFYPEKEWRDDLELGATELALALEGAAPGELPAGLPHTESSFYLGEAARWAKEYLKKSKRNADTLNLYDVSGLAHYELVRALRAAGNPAGLDVTEAQLLAGLRWRARRRRGAVRQGSRSASASRGPKPTPPRMATASRRWPPSTTG